VPERLAGEAVEDLVDEGTEAEELAVDRMGFPPGDQVHGHSVGLGFRKVGKQKVKMHGPRRTPQGMHPRSAAGAAEERAQE
jgi:hypothetical protein